MNKESGDWEARYAASGQLFNAEPSRLLVEHRYLIRPGMSALAVGDGEGRNGVWLAEQGLKVLSVDISPSALERARTRAQQRRVSMDTLCMDLLTWDWPRAEFDLVACIFVHLPPDARRLLHQGIVTALKPGGLLMLEAFHCEQVNCGTGGPADPALLYTTEILEQDFAGMDILHLTKTATDVGLSGVCQGQGVAVHFVGRC